MAHIYRLIVAFAFSLWVFPAFADAPYTEYRICDPSGGCAVYATPWSTSPQAANNIWWVYLDSIQPVCAYGGNHVDYAATTATATVGSAQRTTIFYTSTACTTVSTTSVVVSTVPITSRTLSCVSPQEVINNACVPPCAAGETRIDGVCTPPPCPAGQTRINGICVPSDCPADSTRVNGICVPDPVCPAGYTRVNGTCQKNNCPAAGSSAGSYTGGSTGSFTTCEQYSNTLCGVKIEMDFCAVYGTAKSCQGEGTWTGAGCSSGTGSSPPETPPVPPGDPNAPPTPPAPPVSGTPDAPKPVDPTKPPLPPVQPQPPKPDGSCPDGSSMINGSCIINPAPPDSNGECPPGAVKIGTTCVYTSPAPPPGDGSPPGTGDGNGDGVFGGNCGNGFTCEGGDAVQCAVAKEIHVRNCQLLEDQRNDKAVLYYAEDGKEGKQTDDLPGNDTVSVGPGSFDTSNALGAAGGMSDLTVTVMGQSVTLPFSKVNSSLAILGNILLAISFLVAARIVSRG